MTQDHSPDILPNPEKFRSLGGWSVILVSPQTSENIGAVARLAANFDIGRLILVNPRCDYSLDGPAGKLARESGGQYLEQITVTESLEQALADTHLSFAFSMHDMEDRPADIVGFSSALAGRLTDLDLTDHLMKIQRGSSQRGALVFGREDNGLTNDEASLCSLRWAFLTNPGSPSLNLSSAVGIGLANLNELILIFDKKISFENKINKPGKDSLTDERELSRHIVRANHSEVNGFLSHLEQVMKVSEYERGVPLEHPMRLIRRLAFRSVPTESEIRVLRGICRRILNKLSG